MSDFEMLSIVLMILSIVVTILIAYIKKGAYHLVRQPPYNLINRISNL